MAERGCWCQAVRSKCFTADVIRFSTNQNSSPDFTGSCADEKALLLSGVSSETRQRGP